MDPDEKARTSSEPPSIDRFGHVNWILLAVGLVLLVVGYLTLAAANEDASNLAGLLSPFIILGGYGAIFIALILRSPK